MPFWRVTYHLVWATKKRAPLIEAKLEKELYPYLVKKGAELGVYTYAVNGWVDHVHMVVSAPPKHGPAEEMAGQVKEAPVDYILDEDWPF